jgi:4-hydroxy-3-methylbut-2-enyl diphosphate reductase
VIGLLETEADLAIVMGGKNSSNSSHLVELCERQLPTYFIDDASKILDALHIEKTNWKDKQSEVVENFLPDANPIRILMTSGASCPDIVVESVIKKILSFYQLETAFEKVKESWID